MSDLHNKLEEWLVEKFKVLDSNARKTPGSGCGWAIGDISNKYCYVEAKMKHGNANIIVEFENEWLHLERQLPLKTEKIQIHVTENKVGRKFVTLEAEEFFRLLEEAKG